MNTIRLIAGREIRSRIRTRSWKITTVVMALGIVLLSFLPGFVDKPEKVGVSPSYAATQALTSALGSDSKIQVVPEEEGRSQVKGGDLDAYVYGTQAKPQVLVEQQPDPTLRSALTSLAQQAVLAGAVTELGGDPQTVSAELAAANVQVETTKAVRSDAAQRAAIGFVVGLLLYSSILTIGTLVSQGVVEEKSTRVVEIIVAAVKPTDLMVGKVLGLCAVGGLQLLVVGVAGGVSAVVSGTFSMSAESLLGIVGWVLVWYAVGVVSFAFLYAAAASLVSRQEEVGQAVSPLMTLMIVPYVIGAATLLSNPANDLARNLSFVPLLSPTLMPWRLAAGSATTTEAVIALVLSLVLLPVLVKVSAVVYQRAILHTGTPLEGLGGLEEALTSALVSEGVTLHTMSVEGDVDQRWQSVVGKAGSETSSFGSDVLHPSLADEERRTVSRRFRQDETPAPFDFGEVVWASLFGLLLAVLPAVLLLVSVGAIPALLAFVASGILLGGCGFVGELAGSVQGRRLRLRHVGRLMYRNSELTDSLGDSRSTPVDYIVGLVQRELLKVRNSLKTLPPEIASELKSRVDEATERSLLWEVAQDAKLIALVTGDSPSTQKDAAQAAKARIVASLDEIDALSREVKSLHAERLRVQSELTASEKAESDLRSIDELVARTVTYPSMQDARDHVRVLKEAYQEVEQLEGRLR